MCFILIISNSSLQIDVYYPAKLLPMFSLFLEQVIKPRERLTGSGEEDKSRHSHNSRLKAVTSSDCRVCFWCSPMQLSGQQHPHWPHSADTQTAVPSLTVSTFSLHSSLSFANTVSLIHEVKSHTLGPFLTRLEIEWTEMPDEFCTCNQL